MKWKVLTAIAVLVIAALALRWKDEALMAAAGYFQEAAKEPVPTMRLEPRDYKILVHSRGELTGLKMTPVRAPRVRGGALKIAWIAPEGKIVDGGDLLVRFDKTDAMLSLEKNQNTVTSFDHQIGKSEMDARTEDGILRMDLRQAGIELDYAHNQVRQDETIFSAWEIRESIVSAALAEFKKGALEFKGEIKGKVTEADLQILNIQRKRAESEVEIAQEMLGSLEVRADQQGVVIYSRHGWSRIEVGSQVWPGSPILELAALHQFQGNLQVVENQIVGIEPGGPVQLKISAFPGQTFPGSVKTVAKAPQQLYRKDPRKYFSCTVVLDVPLEVMEQLKPGMRIEGAIQVEEHHAAMIVPKCAIIRKDTEFVAFVKQGREFVETKVEILESDHGFYVVGGLQKGSELALRHPYEVQSLHLPDFNAPAARSQSRRFIMVM
ncbi:MAG: efflux RND transporter periplasmic adaptor subunit [Acidobacteriota bacterium]